MSGWMRERDNHGKVNAGRRTTMFSSCKPNIPRTLATLVRIVHRFSQLSSKRKKKTMS